MSPTTPAEKSTGTRPRKNASTTPQPISSWPVPIREGKGLGFNPPDLPPDSGACPRDGCHAPRDRRRLVRPSHALGPTHPRRRRPRHLRSPLLARLLPPHPLRRSLSQRRRLRRLLPHQNSAALPQPV